MKQDLKISSVFLVMMLLVSSAFAQQEIQHTQFMWDQSSINPAYVGFKESLSGNLFMRRQWLGLEGAPSTENFTVHSPLANRQLGAGLLVWHDQIGISERLAIRAQGAYNLELSKGYLRFGLSAQLSNWSVQWTNTNPDQAGDESIPQADLSDNAFNLGFGAFYHTDRTYIGFAAPQLLEEKYEYMGDQNQRSAQMIGAQALFLNGGHVFAISPKLDLKSSAMLRYISGAPLQLDLSGSVLIKNQLWTGLSYRHLDAISLSLQYLVTAELTIGYAYDWTFSQLQGNGGAHEIFIGFDLRKKKDGFYHPRFF
ncbi:MAG: type IX secretion system membrane protein PorP/SprF [Flavobacteriales bacterium]|nr:type IX secretion system membrane protein PorP/SprF [Flavobacteriales bacterium]